MKEISVAIEGISPILMHRFPMEPIEALEKKTPKEQAQLALYEHEGKPFVPGVNVQRALVSAATFSKGKGRGSLQKNVVAGLAIDEQHLWVGGANGAPATWVVDSRPVVVPATKGRVLRHRPRFDIWKLEFTISYDENLLTREQVKRVLEDCGSRVGLLDFRPERKGPFGRFLVTRFDAGAE